MSDHHSFDAFQVDENMKTAFKRDAVHVGQFYFRKDIITGEAVFFRLLDLLKKMHAQEHVLAMTAYKQEGFLGMADKSVLP